MAARNEVVSCAAGSWTMLTNEAISTDISIEVIDGAVEIWPTTGTTSPLASQKGATLPYVGNGWSQATIAEMFPGFSGTLNLWAKPLHAQPAPAKVFISHAAAA